MYKGKLVFAQLSEHLPKEIFATSVARYAGKYPALTFSYWDQFLCMMFAQLTARSSLRDITTCLRSHSPKCSGQVISDSLMDFFDVDSLSTFKIECC